MSLNTYIRRHDAIEYGYLKTVSNLARIFKYMMPLKWIPDGIIPLNTDI